MRTWLVFYSYTHNLSSSTRFWSLILVQHSTNWAIKPTGNCSLSEFVRWIGKAKHSVLASSYKRTVLLKSKFYHSLTRRETLVSQVETLVSRGGNLLLSGTVHWTVYSIIDTTHLSINSIWRYISDVDHFGWSIVKSCLKVTIQQLFVTHEESSLKQI